MHSGLKYKEEYNKRCGTCESQNLLPKGYPCYKCIRNPVEHREDSYDMWEQWNPYNTSFSSASSWRK